MLLTFALFVLGLVAIGIPLLLVISLVREYKFGGKAKRFVGQVVDFSSIRGQGNRLYSPVVKWVGPDGKSRQFRGATWYAWRRYGVGNHVNVLLGANGDELRVCIDSFADRFGYPLLSLFFCLAVDAWFVFIYYLSL